MERLELNASKRDVGKGVSRKLRREGNVPAILYGVGHDPVPLFVNSKEMDRVSSTEAGWNILLDLKIEGKEKVLARISDYQAHVLNRNLTHIDFQVLDINKQMKTEVPVKLVGKAEGVKQGGILEQIRRHLEVKCLPTQIPEHIDIDVSSLNIGENIHINDVTPPEGVEFIVETNFSIASIVAPTKEIVAEVPAEGEAEVPVEGEAAAPAEGEAAAPAGGKAPAPAEGKAPAAEGKKKESKG